MTDARDYTFTLTGTISARDEDEALSRVQTMLDALDFRDTTGDGTLRLNRPEGANSIRDMALREYRVSITDIGIGHASEAESPVDAEYRE